MPKGRSLFGAVLYGVVNTGLSYVFIYYGLLKVQPGMATVFLALVPLFTLLLTVLHRQEVFRWRTLAGGLLALAGIGVVFQEQLQAKIPLISMISIIMGAVCLSESSLIARIYPRNHPVTTTAIGMVVGAVFQLAVSLAFGEKWVLPTRLVTWASLSYLVLIGGCVVFILVLYTLSRWPASKVSYQFVLMPFVSITASSFLAHEALEPILLVGALLVIAGVFTGVVNFPKRRVVEVEACAACD